jgi:RND family efflux transporter MFP subunit
MKGTIKKIRSMKSSYFVACVMALSTVVWIGSGIVGGEKKDKPLDQPEMRTEQLLPFVRVKESVAQIQNQSIVLFGYTKAIKQADIAAETYNAARRLSKKQFQSKVTFAKVKAELETAKAALSAIELSISKTTIRAPINGSVNKLPLSVGDYVKPGEIVSVVVDLDPIKIVGEVSERDITRIQIGQKAVAHIANGQKVQGLIKYISRVGSSATRTFTVDVWINNPSGTIQEGLTAKLHLPVESGLAHFVSPAVLTLDNEGDIGVKAVNEQSIVTFHRVKIISDTTEGVWLDGLPERLTLITVGQEYVMTGKKVRTTVDAKINSGARAIDRKSTLQGKPS